MKRLLLLWGLLLTLITPTLAQTKTDTILYLDIKPTNESGKWSMMFYFGDNIKKYNISVEWNAYHETYSCRLKPGDKNFASSPYDPSPRNPNNYDLYLQDSGRLYIYYTHDRYDSYDVWHSSHHGVEQMTRLESRIYIRRPYSAISSSNFLGSSALSRLVIDNLQLTSLNVSNSINLTHLHLYSLETKLTSLDVSHNTQLTNLSCSGNQLTSLDVSNNTALTNLSCGNNQLTSLDVSNNTLLTSLYCSGNQLTSLDLSHNDSLTYLECDNNHIPLNMLYKAYTQTDKWDLFTAAPQTDTIVIYNSQLLDLSSERLLGETISDFWISDTSGVGCSDAWTEKDFTFRFHKNGLYKLTLYNLSLNNFYYNGVGNSVGFIWYVSVVESLPDGYFGVQATSNNPEWGIVSTEYGIYKRGSDATITASPNKGYRFINWTKKDGTVFSFKEVYTFSVTEDLELTANFEKLPDDVANENPQTDNLRVYAQDRTIYLSENRGMVQVFNTIGQCVYSGNSTAISVPQPGIYIVRVGTLSYKVLVR